MCSYDRTTNSQKIPSYRRKPVSIPSFPWMPAFAGMTTNEDPTRRRFLEISSSVGERKLMITSW